MTNSSRKRQGGFTIIEAVVSAGVFAVVVASSLAVYMATMQLDSKSRAERAVQQNARFIMEYLAKEVRNGTIDYGRTNTSTTLSLTNQQDEALTFQYDPTTSSLNFTRGSVGTTSLNSDNVRVVGLNFSLYPTTDPFDLANDSHVQPHVVVTLRVESTNPKLTETASINLQSMFATRDYPTRQP